MELCWFHCWIDAHVIDTCFFVILAFCKFVNSNKNHKTRLISPQSTWFFFFCDSATVYAGCCSSTSPAEIFCYDAKSTAIHHSQFSLYYFSDVFFFWARLNHVAMMGMTQVQRVRSAGKTCQAARSQSCSCTRFFPVRYVTLLIPGACCLLKLSYLRVCLCRVEEKYDTPNEKWRFFCFFLFSLFLSEAEIQV